MHNSAPAPSTPASNPLTPPSAQTTQPETPPSPTLQQLQQQINALHQGRAAMSQIIWNLVRKYEPTEEQVVVSSLASDPLWQLAFVAADAANSDPSKVRVLAGLLPPISEQEKKKVVRLLRGTNTPMIEALATLNLPYPTDYVEQQIKAHLVWKKGAVITSELTTFPEGVVDRWESVTPASLAERAKNILHLPKA